MSIFYQQRQKNFQSFLSHNNSYPAHLHTEVEFTYVISGQISISIDDQTYFLQTGDCCLAFPNTIHRLETIEQSDIILCFFSLDFLNDFFKDFSEFRPKYSMIPKSQLSTDAEYAVKRLIQLSPCTEGTFLHKGYLMILISELLNSLHLKPFSSSTEMTISQQLLSYIDTHYTESLSLETIAKALGVSKFYLSHIFSDKLHTSYTAYLSGKRIEFAKTLLTSSSLSITDIAYESGFSSTRTFFRTFEEICKITPKAYRSKYAAQSLQPSEEANKE